MPQQTNPEKFLIVSHPADILTLLQSVQCGTFPGGTLIVPCDLARQGLRRVAGEKAVQILTGWRMLTPREAALEIFHGAGIPAQAASNGLRAAILEAMLAVDPDDIRSETARDWLQEAQCMQEKLGYFELDQLRNGAGYPAAITRTMESLASAGCDPASLLKPELGGIGGARVRDIATMSSSLRTVIAGLDENHHIAASAHATIGDFFNHATSVMASSPEAWLTACPTIIWLDDPSQAELVFLARLRPSHVAIQRKRPVRTEYVDLLKRIEKLFGGNDILESVRQPGRVPETCQEIDIVQAKLFDSSGVVPTASKPPDPDGSVHLELHACVEDELQAAVQWVAREVFEHNTPLEQIAILFPAMDPLAGMFVERLRELQWPGEDPVPAFVAGGLPATHWSIACRVDGILSALEDGLSADSLRRALPCLVHISSTRAGEIVYSCGATGGTPGNPAAGLAWADALSRREQLLAEQVKEQIGMTADEDPESRRYVRGLRQTERLLEGIRLVLPAVQALQNTLRLIIDNKSLAEIWPVLRPILTDVRSAAMDPPVLERLDEAVEPLLAMAAGETLQGPNAIRVLRDMLKGLRIRHGRLGEPRVFVGQISDARWLSFRAVRICGLCEGTVPSIPSEDAVLPDSERSQLATAMQLPIVSAGHAVLRQLQAFHHAVCSAGERLVLSAPREWIDGCSREPSSVLMEVADVLGRKGRVTSLKSLQQDYFVPGCRNIQEFRNGTPLTTGAQLARAAALDESNTRIVPVKWLEDGILSLPAIRDRHRMPANGIVLADEVDVVLPGTASSRPVSAYRLMRLVTCPYRFVMQDVLYWDEPFEAPSMDEIDAMPYGSLLHRVMERFYKEYGAEFRRAPGSRNDWHALAEKIARETMNGFLQEYPLLGEATRANQLYRLLRDVRTLITYDQSRPESDSVMIEQAFGDTDGLPLPLGDGRELFVRGYIDRVEKNASGTTIWDIKSGRLSSPGRTAIGPDPDLQLAVYLHAVNAERKRLELPPVTSVAYVSPQDRGARTRSFAGDDLQELTSQSSRWLNMAAMLLAERHFPYAVQIKACQYCPFKILCGEDIFARSDTHLRTLPEQSVAGLFLDMNSGEDQQ